MRQQATEYSMKIKLAIPYPLAVEKVTEALKAEGFGILTRIDVKETLREKLDVGFRDYVILGACNPPLAHRALSANLDVGLLLPCNVVVYQENGGSVVSIMDPISMLGAIHDPHLVDVAREARGRLERVVKALES